MDGALPMGLTHVTAKSDVEGPPGREDKRTQKRGREGSFMKPPGLSRYPLRGRGESTATCTPTHTRQLNSFPSLSTRMGNYRLPWGGEVPWKPGAGSTTYGYIYSLGGLSRDRPLASHRADCPPRGTTEGLPPRGFENTTSFSNRMSCL